MSMVISKDGVIFLAKTVLNLAKTVGNDAALKVVEGQPDLFLELINEKHILEKTPRENLTPTEWKAENAETYLKNLKLTDIQTILLKTIVQKNNLASLTDLEKELKKNKIKVTTGSMIGGSLAGITKKCDSYRIPPIYKIDNTSSEPKYFIVPEALGALSNYFGIGQHLN